MTVTDQLTELQGSAFHPAPAAGRPTKIWAADVTAVNNDGTVNLRPVFGRASKVNVTVPDGYSPTVGDRVLATNINGEAQYPAVLVALTSTPPAVTGSRSSGAALQGLLTVLAAAGLIVNNTTT